MQSFNITLPDAIANPLNDYIGDINNSDYYWIAEWGNAIALILN
ncbi:hypothetical protein [Nostoc sp.]